jgi:hypothetical protein
MAHYLKGTAATFGVDAVTKSAARLGQLSRSAAHGMVTNSQEMQAVSRAMLI